MSNYLRPSDPGATIFFTVALADRTSDLLVREIGLLRQAVRITRAERPFSIDAWVVLLDHLHCVWTLPDDDADFSTRWSVIKALFALSVPEGARRPSHVARRERGVWQRRFWGEARPEIGPVDRFQRRTGEAPAAKPIMSGTRRITRPWFVIVG